MNKKIMNLIIISTISITKMLSNSDLQKTITVKNLSDHDIIMVISNEWCNFDIAQNAQAIYIMLANQAIAAYAAAHKGKRIIAPRINDPICFSALVSAYGGSVTCRPEKFSPMLGISSLNVTVWDSANNTIGLRENVTWGEIILYPVAMTLQKNE